MGATEGGHRGIGRRAEDHRNGSMTDLTRLASGEYGHNGRTIPGVTRVLALLRPYAGVPRDTLAFAQQRGSAAHRAIPLLAGGRGGVGPPRHRGARGVHPVRIRLHPGLVRDDARYPDSD